MQNKIKLPKILSQEGKPNLTQYYSARKTSGLNLLYCSFNGYPSLRLEILTDAVAHLEFKPSTYCRLQ